MSLETHNAVENTESQAPQTETREQSVDEAIQRCEANPDATPDYKNLMLETWKSTWEVMKDCKRNLAWLSEVKDWEQVVIDMLTQKFDGLNLPWLEDFADLLIKEWIDIDYFESSLVWRWFSKLKRNLKTAGSFPTTTEALEFHIPKLKRYTQNTIEWAMETTASAIEKITNLQDSLNLVSNNTIGWELQKKLGELLLIPANLENEELLNVKMLEIEELLWFWEWSKLWELLAAAEESSDPTVSTNLRKSLISFNPNFKARIDNYDWRKKLPWAMPSLLQPKWSTEDRNDGSIDVRTFNSSDGSITKIDTSTFPPKRTVSLEGSDYTMETETPMTKDIQEASTKYEVAHNKLSPRINSLSNLIDEIPWLDSTDVKSVKDYLLSMLSYSFKSNNPDIVQTIESADSMSDLKGNKLMVLKGLKDKAEKELKDAEDEYKQTLNDQVDSYREMMSEKDDKTKKILKTLQDTGFDILPQSVTDQLIAEMESGQLMPQFERSFDVKNIDLANGDFWESETLENSDELFVQNIVRFMNKLAGLNPDGSNWDGVLVWLSEKSYEIGHAPKTPQEIIQLLKESNVMLANDTIDIVEARKRLSANTREDFRKAKENSAEK